MRGRSFPVVSYSVPISNHNLKGCGGTSFFCCILFCSYIKPQLRLAMALAIPVVSYSVPISNHNKDYAREMRCYVVSYSVPISNHNLQRGCINWRLGCILFCSYIKPQLNVASVAGCLCCILFCSYIKPQHIFLLIYVKVSCILFCSYIKPQRLSGANLRIYVVSYSVPISNHN